MVETKESVMNTKLPKTKIMKSISEANVLPLSPSKSNSVAVATKKISKKSSLKSKTKIKTKSKLKSPNRISKETLELEEKPIQNGDKSRDDDTADDFPWEDMTCKLQMAAQRMVKQDQVILQHEGVVTCMNQLIDSLKSELNAVQKENDDKDRIISQLRAGVRIKEKPSIKRNSGILNSDKPNTIRAKIMGVVGEAPDVKSFLFGPSAPEGFINRKGKNIVDNTISPYKRG